MDFDLEIISEEGESPDPLFSTIISAMNSMKEATADKIYQKIQKEGDTNYSKPQVDRALASALKYGIFEVKNNRYRVRDDFLDDEDTVYWQLQRKREQTPFRIKEDINDRQGGTKLDPEKDKMRYKKVSSKEKNECPQCGRAKRPLEEVNEEEEEEEEEEEKEKKIKKAKRGRKSKSKRPPKKRRKSTKRKAKAKVEEIQKNGEKLSKRKTKRDTVNEEKSKKTKCSENNQPNITQAPTHPSGTGQSLSLGSDFDLLSSPSDDEQSFTSYNDDTVKYRKKKSYQYLTDDLQDNENKGIKTSCTSIKSESESDQTDASSASDEPNQTSCRDEFFESLPCTSRNAQLASHSSGSSYQNQLNSDFPADGSQEKQNWMECSDEPQGTIIESHNVLTIEPMDMLVFKSPEQASYIS